MTKDGSNTWLYKYCYGIIGMVPDYMDGIFQNYLDHLEHWGQILLDEVDMPLPSFELLELVAARSLVIATDG
eukprot:14548614-Ditylum_brightwellii.AAC.1